MSTWTKTEDRLPELRERVLVKLPRLTTVAYRAMVRRGLVNWIDAHNKKFLQGGEIIAWCKIPEYDLEAEDVL